MLLRLLICSRCEVRSPCLSDAITPRPLYTAETHTGSGDGPLAVGETTDVFSVRGGTTPRDRWVLRALPVTEQIATLEGTFEARLQARVAAPGEKRRR